MKKTLILATAAAVLAGGSFGGESTLPDAQVRRALNWIYDCFDGDHQSDMNALFARTMNYDTNQFVRVAKEMAASNERPRQMLAIISKYDLQQGIPYLYGYTTNENSKVAFTACRLILGREGLTSNSVAAVAMFLSSDAPQYDTDRKDLCRQMLRQARQEGVSEEMRDLAGRCAKDFAAADCSYVKAVDEAIVAFDPAYQYSTNRLEVLRASLGQDINDYQRNYVTNAIHEIEARPPQE